MDEIVYTYEDIVTDTSVLNEAPDFFEEGKTICTGYMDDQPQALVNFLFSDDGLSALPHITEGRNQIWEKIEGVFDMEYEVYEKSEWLHPYIRRSQVYLKVRVEYDVHDKHFFKIYRLDENDNII